MTHPFLKGVDWSALAMASIKSPLQEAAIIFAKELKEAPPKDSAEIDSGPYRGVVPATSWFGGSQMREIQKRGKSKPRRPTARTQTSLENARSSSAFTLHRRFVQRLG